MRTLNFSDYSLSRFISLYTSFPGFYSRKKEKKRVQSTKKQNFFITVHSRAVICNFFSSEKKVFESVATFDVSLLCPSKLSLLHNLQDKQEKGNLHAHRWRIEAEVRFFLCMHLYCNKWNTLKCLLFSKCFFFPSCQTCKGTHGMECIFLV